MRMSGLNFKITLEEMLKEFEGYRHTDAFDLYEKYPGEGYYEIFGRFVAIALNNENHRTMAYEM
jgi:hypothetical protein